MALGIPDIAEGIKSLVKTLNPVVKESTKIAATSSKGMMKVAADMKTPLQDMSSFFASIDGGIRKIATSVGETTGISKVMAKIMGEDLKITKKKEQDDKKNKSIKGAKGKVDSKDVVPFGEGILASLKDAFDNIIPKQSIGELGKILLLATGAAILIKLASKFQNLLAPVLEFFFETLIPGFQELNAAIMSSPTGYLGVGGLVVGTQLAVAAYGGKVSTFFTNIKTAATSNLLKFGKMMNPFVNFAKPKEAKAFASAFQRITGPLSRLGTFISNLAKTVGGGAKTILKLIPMVSKFATFGKSFIRFLGPVGLVIQAFVGLFSGITRAISTFKAGGSIFAVIGSFFSGIFDALIGSVVNLLADLLGFIVKKLGFEKLGEMISNIDFTTEGIGKAIVFVIDKIKNAFGAFVDMLKGAANSVIKKLNLIPGVNIDLLETRQMKKEREEGTKGSGGTNMAEDLALNERARVQGNENRLKNVTGTTVTAIGDTTTEKFNFKQEKAKVLKAEQEKLATQQTQSRTLQNINSINNSKGPTTVNQTSVHSNGEPASDHNDMTAKHLTAAFAV